MLTAIKISAMALIAVVALPPYGHEPTAPSDPSAVSVDAIVSAAAPDHSRLAPPPEGMATPTGEVAHPEVAHTQAALPVERVADAAPPAPALPAKLPLAIGDNLKIGFFETIDVGSGAPSGAGDGAEPQGALRTFYQRMDLSGDYAIEPDGGISIPLLGRFQIEGRAVDEVRADLAASFNTVIGKNANVDVKILDRAPVYVVGPVKSPGAYKYVPRMIVLQALALAGGLDRGGDNLSGMVEGAREMERLRVETLQVEHLIAQRARLEAERDGVSALSVPADSVSYLLPDEGVSTLPIRLAKMDLERTAGTFLSRESAILRAEQAKRQQEDQEIALRAASARSEISELKRKLDQFDVEKGLRNERLDAMQKLKERGVVTTNNVLLLRTELADIEARRQDSLVEVLQAKARLTEAEGDVAKLSSENTANLEKEIATVDNEIAAAREAAISATALATVLYKPGESTGQATYEIVRASKDGAKTLQATETSALMPGDVLKINPGGAASINANPTRSSTQSSLAPSPNTRTAIRN